jgi:hypothetical protein
VKKRAYLFGPFVGELFWEAYRFVPHFIYLRKENPGLEFIVFTRQSRFDLYGKYANILIPLKIKNDVPTYQDCFKLNGLSHENYYELSQRFKKKYLPDYNIKKHLYPDIFWRYNLKWQYPRHLMNYDFSPRKRNGLIINTLTTDKSNIVFLDKPENSLIKEFDSLDYNIYHEPDFLTFISERMDTKSSYLGCIINMIKKSNFVVGNMDSVVPRLSILLKTPIICINETMTDDDIHLLNPLNTPVIKCKNIKEGIEIYENNIRS